MEFPAQSIYTYYRGTRTVDSRHGYPSTLDLRPLQASHGRACYHARKPYP